MSEGVDYASVDGDKPPDFAAAHAAGLSFVIIRGAYTFGAPRPDLNLARDRDAAQRAGLRVGSYLILDYSPHGPTPEAQAHAFITAYGARRSGELPVALDAETNSLDHSASTGATRIAWLLRAYDALKACYGVVMTYTSENQWSENFGDVDCRLGDGPLWVKVPYPWNARNKPHPESCPPVGVLPRPWRRPGSPGAWIEQYQGDATGSTGFSSTVDLNRFLPYVDDGRPDARAPWVRSKAPVGVKALQTVSPRVPDGIVGPTTFCDLTIP